MVANEKQINGETETKVLQHLHVDEWTGCYRGRWKGIISDEAHCHPAKYARSPALSLK